MALLLQNTLREEDTLRKDSMSKQNKTIIMSHICKNCISIHIRVWKDMSLDPSITEIERSKLAVWEYPVSDAFTKVSLLLNESVNQ